MPQTVRRGRFARPILLAVALLAITATCSRDVGKDILSLRPSRAVPVSYDQSGFGLDPGFVPTDPLREIAVCGAAVPRIGQADLPIAFVAFTTAAAAQDGDGRGHPLDRTGPSPTDTNGANDVFLAAVVDDERMIRGQSVPASFTQGIAPIMRDPRCIRCHSFHYPGGWREAGHVGHLPSGTNEGCERCHASSDVLRPGIEPATLQWFAPDVEQQAVPTQDFRGKTDAELLERVMSRNDPANHLRSDGRILWAIAHGRVPLRGDANGGRVPMDPQQWQNLVDAWEVGGLQFGTDVAMQDVVLVSRRAAVAASGNGASDSPTVTFEANSSFNAALPTAQPLGWVHVAFSSAATDLVAGVTATNRNVWRTIVQVWFTAQGKIDLRYDSATTRLVSRSTTATIGGNGASDQPSISGDGGYVAYRSNATNLVGGFTGGGLVTNIWVTRLATNATTLISTTGGTGGGNGDSAAPRMSETGNVVAFESDASDLVNDDTNGARDVFTAREEGFGVVVRRASVRSDGSQAVGGASTNARVWRDPNTDDVWTAFESTADFGLGGAAEAVLLHQLQTGTTIRLGDGSPARSPAIAPNGRSVAFVTAAAIDGLRTDGNAFDDVVALDLVALKNTGARSYSRLSLAVTGNDADGTSAQPVLAALRDRTGALTTDQVVAFTTTATNLGRAANTSHVVQFALDRTVQRTSAEFSAEPTAGLVPLTVQFNDLSSNATSWQWTFGDGATSTERSPSHIYTTPSAYTVTLQVTGPNNNGSITKTDFVFASGTPKPWSQIYTENSLQSSCGTGSTSCHSSTHAQSASNFAMQTANVAYDNLVGIASVRGCAPALRVAPGDFRASTLIDAVSLTPTCVSSRMGSLSQQAIQDLRDWITAGAPR